MQYFDNLTAFIEDNLTFPVLDFGSIDWFINWFHRLIISLIDWFNRLV